MKTFRPLYVLHLLRLGRRTTATYILVLPLVSVFLIGVIAGTSPNNRTFSLKALTFGAEIAFKGHQNTWRFDAVWVCRPRDVPDPRLLSASEHSLCNEGVYVAEQFEDHLLHWDDGEDVKIDIHNTGALQLTILASPFDRKQEGTLYLIPKQDWQRAGALTFKGVLTVGGEMGTGSKDYLIDATWEALQSGFWTSLLRNTTEVVKTGVVFPGASIDFVAPDQSVTSYGHITPDAEGPSPFRVAALTERANVSLRASYFGLEEPTVFKPDMIDEVSSSAIIIALAVLMSLLAAFLEIVSIAMRWLSGSLRSKDV